MYSKVEQDIILEARKMFEPSYWDVEDWDSDDEIRWRKSRFSEIRRQFDIIVTKHKKEGISSNKLWKEVKNVLYKLRDFEKTYKGFKSQKNDEQLRRLISLGDGVIDYIEYIIALSEDFLGEREDQSYVYDRLFTLFESEAFYIAGVISRAERGTVSEARDIISESHVDSLEGISDSSEPYYSLVNSNYWLYFIYWLKDRSRRQGKDYSKKEIVDAVETLQKRDIGRLDGYVKRWASDLVRRGW